MRSPPGEGITPSISVQTCAMVCSSTPERGGLLADSRPRRADSAQAGRARIASAAAFMPRIVMAPSMKMTPNGKRNAF